MRAKRLLQKWRKRLGLDDWAISCEVVGVGDLEPDTWANCTWDCDGQTATVWLWCGIADDAMESVVLHELLHIVMDGHRAVPAYSVNRERSIEKLVRALLRLKHQ